MGLISRVSSRTYRYPKMAEGEQSQSQETRQETPNTGSKLNRLTAMFSANKLDAMSWVIRVYLVYLAATFMLLGGALPAFDANYKKALTANAFVACIRLHQRLNGNFGLSREHFQRVFTEDAAHYLLYSMVFLMQPIKLAMCLVPIALMALIHCVKYGYKVCDALNIAWGRNMLNAVATRQQMLFRFVALTEIFMLPVVCIMVFLGLSSFIAPFIYFRYVKLRYYSQRNTYSKQVFYELRVVSDQYKFSASTPNVLKKIINFGQGICFKFA